MLPHWWGEDTHRLWVSRFSEQALRARAAELKAADPVALPLYGIPFAVKDNIDVLGLPTTAGCPAFGFEPKASATVVARLLAAGAICVGKTAMDQFAAGLVGTRAPAGPCVNAFDPEYISGGSSSGSAVAVALGQVSFALGTDTAGSGRVPAAFNNLLGLKPSCGLLSTRGVVPAAPSLDCVSVFALSAHDALAVLNQTAGFDAADPYSRVVAPLDLPEPGQGLRFGVPRYQDLEFYGDGAYREAYAEACARLAALGIECVPIDITPLLAIARSLYGSARLAERIAALQGFLKEHWSDLHAITAQVLAPGYRYRAEEAFQHLSELRRAQSEAAMLFNDVHGLCLPTAPTHYRLSEVAADPIGSNARLGHYTNFVNLLDLSAVAVPTARLASGRPFGVSLIAPAGSDRSLLALADRLHRGTPGPTGVQSPEPLTFEPVEWPELECLPIAVCGAHMRGLPLNHQLTSRGGRFVMSTSTDARYRLYALPGGPPFRPGLVRDETGEAIEVEVWALPKRAYGELLSLIPPPLALGRVFLADGRAITGFVCERWGLAGAEDITSLKSWRTFLAQG